MQVLAVHNIQEGHLYTLHKIKYSISQNCCFLASFSYRYSLLNITTLSIHIFYCYISESDFKLNYKIPLNL
jgi:hypothetical protein